MACALEGYLFCEWTICLNNQTEPTDDSQLGQINHQTEYTAKSDLLF